MKVYFRGTVPGETKRIKTGVDAWDNNLFCSLNRELASCYGSQIEKIALKPEAKVLIQGQKCFYKIFGKQKQSQNFLDWSTAGIIKAKEFGYDVVEFERQGDVGTVIMNEDIAIRDFQESYIMESEFMKLSVSGGIYV